MTKTHKPPLMWLLTFITALALSFTFFGIMPDGALKATAAGTVSDALMIQQYIAGWSVKINLTNADVDGDKEITVTDALLIQQHIAGWSVTLK